MPGQSSRPPPPLSLPQTSGDSDGRLQGASRCMDPACNLLTSSGGVASRKAKWRADLLLQFKAGSSEDASSDAKLGVAWGDQPPLDLWEIAGVSPCTRLTPDLASLQDTPCPPSILSELWVSPSSVLGRSPPSPHLAQLLLIVEAILSHAILQGKFFSKILIFLPLTIPDTSPNRAISRQAVKMKCITFSDDDSLRGKVSRELCLLKGYKAVMEVCLNTCLFLTWCV